MTDDYTNSLDRYAVQLPTTDNTRPLWPPVRGRVIPEPDRVRGPVGQSGSSGNSMTPEEIAQLAQALQAHQQRAAGHISSGETTHRVDRISDYGHRDLAFPTFVGPGLTNVCVVFNRNTVEFLGTVTYESLGWVLCDRLRSFLCTAGNRFSSLEHAQQFIVARYDEVTVPDNAPPAQEAPKASRGRVLNFD